MKNKTAGGNCPGGDYVGCPRRGSQGDQKGKCERCGFDFDQQHLTPASVEEAREAARAEIARKENEERKAREKRLPEKGDAGPATPASPGKDVPPRGGAGEKKPEPGHDQPPGGVPTRGAAKPLIWSVGPVLLGIVAIGTWAPQLIRESEASKKYAALQQANEESERRARQFQEEKANGERLAAELAEARRQSDRLKEEQEKMRLQVERMAAERKVEDEKRVQAEAAKRAQESARKPVPVAASLARQPIEPDLVAIPGGSFLMGSPESEALRESDEVPQHRVSVPAFWMGKTEVTQGQWKAVMGSNPSRFTACGDDCPVENVRWDDIQEFLKKLNARTGKQYRLPSEAEWEYAARAGTTTAFHTGNCVNTNQANYDGNKDDANCGAKTGVNRQRTVRVGSFAANAFGLHDMIGNVWEWTQDCWNRSYSGAPTNGGAWTSGDCGWRVLRGGSWYYFPQSARSANRLGSSTGGRGNDGFRVALSAARTLP